MSLKETMQQSAQSWAETIELQQSQQQLSQQVTQLTQTVEELQQENLTLRQHLADSISAQATSQTALLELSQRLLALESQAPQNSQNSSLNQIETRVKQVESQVVSYQHQLDQQAHQLNDLNQTYRSLQQSLSAFTQQLETLNDESAIADQKLQNLEEKFGNELSNMSQWIDHLNSQIQAQMLDGTTEQNLDNLIRQASASQQMLSESLQDLQQSIQAIEDRLNSTLSDWIAKNQPLLTSYGTGITNLKQETKTALKQVTGRIKEMQEQITTLSEQKRGWFG